MPLKAEVWIPGPLPVISANQRQHYHLTARHVREAKDRAIGAIRAKDRAIPTFDGEVGVEYDIRLPDLRRRDADNLIAACKPYLDAIVDEGILPDDNWQTVSMMVAVVSLDRQQPGVLITIMEVPDMDAED